MLRLFALALLWGAAFHTRTNGAVKSSCCSSDPSKSRCDVTYSCCHVAARGHDCTVDVSVVSLIFALGVDAFMAQPEGDH